MYDVDPQRPVLRLSAVQPDKPVEAVEPRSTAEILALAERQMEEAIKRWSSAYMDWTRERKQSQPIAFAQPRTNEQKLSEWLEKGAPSWTKPSEPADTQPIGDSMMRYR